jgi:putative membrane protein
MPQPPLTDLLAIDRTTLANERTLLAYTRTALGLLVLGVSFLQFLQGGVYHVSAYLFCALALVVQATGIYRFVRVRNHLIRLRARGDENE